MARGAAVANVFAGVHGPGRPARARLFPPYADDAPIRAGDVFVIDMSGSLDGYFFDFSRSRVAGEDRHGAAEAQAIAKAVVTAAVEALRPGATVGEAARAGWAAMEAAADDLDHGGFDALGHGLGLGFETPWVTPDDETPLVPGMCIAIEKFVSRGDVAAAFEHDVLVTDGAPEILSVAPG
jgi:Xaa-Pro aminopeptidase